MTWVEISGCARVDGYNLVSTTDGARLAVREDAFVRLERDRALVSGEPLHAALETADFIWYLADDDDRCAMFSKDGSGLPDRLASDNYHAENAADEALEAIWRGEVEPLFMEEGRFDLEDMASVEQWGATTLLDRLEEDCSYPPAAAGGKAANERRRENAR